MQEGAPAAIVEGVLTFPNELDIAPDATRKR
jgi:hypothetical protein